MTEILYEEIYIWKAVVWRSWKFSKFYLCSERLSVLSPRLHPSMQRDQGGAQLWYLLTVWLAQYQRHRHLHGALNILGKNISQENVRWHWIGRTCWKPVSPGAQWGIPAVSRFPSNYIEMKQWAISRILISPIGAVQPCLLSCFAMRVCCCCYLLQPTVGLPRDNLLVEWANTITITAKTITTLSRTGCPCTGCPHRLKA